MKKVVSYFLVIILITFPSLILAVNSKDEINITKNAKSAIMIEATTGEILYNKDANKIVSVASLTKMMSLILFFEFMEKGGMTYDETITISENAKNIGGTQIWLDVGEKISVEDLLKGIVMASANDATVALAERVAGTEEAFVNQMNKKVKELGLKNTNFKNCTGFDEKEHFSTAYDMAIIAKELINHEEIFNFSSIYEAYIRENTNNKTWIVNTNKLVRFYDGADGLKTGWTEEAGSCMAVTAKKNNLRLIAITLGYANTTTRNAEAMELLNYGFNQYKVNLLYKKGSVVGTTTLDKAQAKEIKLISSEDILILQKKTEENKKVTTEIKLNNISFPIKKGDTLGIVYIKEGRSTLKKANLVAEKDIKKVSIVNLYFNNLKNILTGN